LGKHRSAQSWADHILACDSGEVSVTQYCLLHGLPRRGFTRWRRRLELAGHSEPAATLTPLSDGRWLRVESDLHEVLAVPKSAGERAPLTIRIAGAQIDVCSDFDPVLLRAVVLALGAAPC
jgi:hypothetical protein